MIRIANSLRFALLFLTVTAVPIQAQVRLGLAHQIEASARAAEPPKMPAVATHDPDSDGALIGAAVGAAGLGLFWGLRDDSGLGGLAVVGGVLIGGLGGLVIGAGIDAADPFSSEDATAPAHPDSAAMAEPAEAADTTAPAAAPSTPRSPTSRRNDLIGAVTGAVAGELIAVSVCTSISEGDRCGFFRYAYLPVIGVGALLGAGIGSTVGPGGSP